MEVVRKNKVSVYRFDNVTVGVGDFRLHKDGQPQKITPRAFEVLIYLIENRGRLVEKQELFEQIWKESFVTDNALTRVVKEIRQVIGDNASLPSYIETVPKHGYRFIGEVSQIEDEKPYTVPPVEIAAIESQNKEFETQEERTQTDSKIIKSGNYTIWFAAASLLILILAAISYLIFFNGDVSNNLESPQVVRTLQVTNWTGLDNYPAISPDGNSIAYSSDHNGSSEIYVKSLAAGAREIQITSDGAQNYQPAWSPDGQQIAYYSRTRGGIWIVPASGGSTKQLTDFGSSPAFSPDGKTIAFQSGGLTDIAAGARTLPPSVLWLIPATGGEARQLTQSGNPAGGHSSPAWSPDGKMIAFNVEDILSFNIWTLSIADGKVQTVAENAFDAVFARDGKSIYHSTLSGISNTKIPSDVGSESIGEQIKIVNAEAMPVRHLSISANGKRIAYSMLRTQSSIWSLALNSKSGIPDGQAAPLIQNTSTRNTFPTISPDGQKIGFVSYNPGSRGEFWLTNPEGKNPTPTTINVIFPNWFPDNQQIASFVIRDNKMKLAAFNLTTGKETILLDSINGEFSRLSPDGKELIFNSKQGGAINLWHVRLADGVTKQLTFDHELMGFPAWSPDGEFIAFQVKRAEDTHIAIMPREGGAIEQITNEQGQSWVGSFSPDGDKIVFAGQRNYIWNLYWISRTTKEQKQITSNTKSNAYVRYPAWSPRGNQIVYEYAETTGNIWLTELK